jgi:hypothetical protein
MMSDEMKLSVMSDGDRYNVYQMLLNSAQHLWSKGKIQKDKLKEVLDVFIKLADDDPIFLAHFCSWAVKSSENKDLKVVSTFVNSLSDADGMPFVVSRDGGKIEYSTKFKKPNFRLISQAAVQELDPKLVLRVLEIANIKQSLGKRYKDGTHLSRSLKNAVVKYIRFRENYTKALEGIKKVGLGKVFQDLYRCLHIAPSTEAAEILRWIQKDGRKIKKRKGLDFKGLSDIEIAEKIRSEKISPLVALGALPDKLSPVIAIAILEQSTGNQAVILRSIFDSQGLLKNKEVLNLFEEKIKTAKTALDRVEKLNKEVDADVEKILKSAKADKRKEQVGDIGKIFLHLDISGSMQNIVEYAKEHGAIFAECVKDPEKNFFWGTFNDRGTVLNRPTFFEKDAFMAALYGVHAGGGTNCLALYRHARSCGCDVDIYVTDQNHTTGIISNMIRDAGSKPKVSVIIDFGHLGLNGRLAKELMANDIPVSIIKPEALKESALVAQAVKSAVKGSITVIDEIMEFPLLKLPEWWSSI